MWKKLVDWLSKSRIEAVRSMLDDAYAKEYEQHKKQLEDLKLLHSREIKEYREKLILWTSRMHGRCPPEWLNELHQCDKWVKK